MTRLAFVWLLLGAISSTSCSLSSSSSLPLKSSPILKEAPPIVYTIAGSDSGGGAGIQADLHAIRSMKCHGCSAITCLTAQNSVGVTAVHAPPASFLRKQLDTLTDDLRPRAIKIGMLGTEELAIVVGEVLKEIKKKDKNIWVVLDPVMISTSGSKLINDDAIEAMIQNIFPFADVVTPNKFEAEAFLGRELKTPEDVEKGAKDLLAMGCKAVLIKGGHALTESSSSGEATASAEVKATLDYAQDYLLSSEMPPGEGNERLCDGSHGVWLRTNRYVFMSMSLKR
jgi:hydroxymethylpyrimidine kinase/phosphomethylpyrimidine kinase